MRAPALPALVAIVGGRPLSGTLRPPGDKSISHRGLLLAALAEGTSVLRGLADGDDVVRTAAAIEALGATVEAGPGELVVHGGRSRLREPTRVLDCGNSGTTMRLLAGLLATTPWRNVLVGDASLSSRPMDRIAEPLRAMGASVEGHGPRCEPPLTVKGGALRGITWAPPVASAQVKSAVLLAGLGAEGPTVVEEAVTTRTHTEELLTLAGAPIKLEEQAGGGRRVTVRPADLHPFELDVAADPSQAAFWVVAGSLVRGSTVTLHGLYRGPARLGFLHVLSRMGARLEMNHTGATITVTARTAELTGTDVEAAEVPSLDEVPALAVAAAAASGTTTFRSMAELRVKESDRLQAVALLVQTFGARAEIRGDDLVVTGVGPGRPLRAGHHETGGDHRIAMAAAVGALAAEGRSTVDGFDAVATSYPGFLVDLGRLGGAAGPAATPLVAIDGPGGAGKSTVARRVAEALGIARLDTGAMYRAVTWAALRQGVALHDGEALAELTRRLELDVGERVVVAGVDVTEAIRTEDVSRAVSEVAAHREVRRILVERQRTWVADHGAAVVEGRDIATVVLPHADLKVFLTASEEERGRRRADEPQAELRRRDHLDSSRATSPLRPADDARVLDTTGRGVDEVVAEILSWL